MECLLAGFTAPVLHGMVCPEVPTRMTAHPASPDKTQAAGPARWARAMSDPAAFAAEQEQLGHVWTFLGLASEIPAVNDWFTTVLGGRSIFVQRFESGLRAYENRCAHRFYPLRIGRTGHGPVVCGFHHWRYNAEGRALGIPKCIEMYGRTPRDIDARLREVELAQCGDLVFGRFPGRQHCALAEWLGPGHAILARLGEGLGKPDRFACEVAANWKLMMGISLDDYHVVAVHPGSFGKAGYIPPETIHYTRFNAHSAYLPGSPPGTLQAIAEACRAGNYVPERYRIFQFFPGLIVALIKALDYAGDTYWFVLIQHLEPLAPGRTRTTTRFAPLPFGRPAGPVRKAFRAFTMPWMRLGVRIQSTRIHAEDHRACEQLQLRASQADAMPILSRQETRVGWFEESYARILDGHFEPDGVIESVSGLDG